MKFFEIEFVFISETEKKGKESSKDIQKVRKKKRIQNWKLVCDLIECIIQRVFDQSLPIINF